MFEDIPHRRYNPLTREWVLVSPQRTKRPWLGRVERIQVEELPPYDPDCYLCPGNRRAGGVRNPHYTGTFVFDNDFPALLPDIPYMDFGRDGILVAKSERGLCRVVCFSPRHDITIPEMDEEEIGEVVDVLTDQWEEIGSLPFINYVQIFENKGEMMGCSNPHPHCQIWANETIPVEPSKEQASQIEYMMRNGKCLLCTYLSMELEEGTRLVCENDHFVALVPFWAIWPFETMILSRRHIGSLPELSKEERLGLANILKRLTTRYDNLFEIPFPYSMGFHQKPTDGEDHEEWHIHLHFYPPLLRSATIRKFMVGYEMLANPQRDITPEKSAEMLRSLPEVHYRALRK